MDVVVTGSLNAEAICFYNEVIDTMLANGIEPYINLFHFDMPVELQHKYGGFESKHVVDLYAAFARQCFKLFGDRVNNWFTFNEPKVILDGAYLYKFHYPLKVNGPLSVQVAYNINLASAKAILEFNKLYGSNKEKKIGIILNLTPAYPASESEADKKAANIAELRANKMFLDPSIKGKFPEELGELLRVAKVLWDATSLEVDIIKNNTIDNLGVNY